MDKTWLKKKVSVEDVEKEHVITSVHNPAIKEPTVFGFVHDQWETFKTQIQDGDELWEFCSDDGSWGALSGRAGYSIMRDGEIINSFVTILS